MQLEDKSDEELAELIYAQNDGQAEYHEAWLELLNRGYTSPDEVY